MITKDELLKYMAQGLTDKEIGEKIFYSPRTVELYRLRYGLKRKNSSYKFPGEEAFRTLVDSGLTTKEIAEKLQAHPSTVSNWKKRYLEEDVK